MSAYLVTAPLVVLRDEKGSSHHFYENTQVSSEGMDQDHIKQLVETGMLEKVKASSTPAPADDAEPTTVKGILAAVGDDKAKAQEYLDKEKAGENRPTLVEKLEAIANPAPAGA